jgi:hypothetical protein
MISCRVKAIFKKIINNNYLIYNNNQNLIKIRHTLWKKNVAYFLLYIFKKLIKPIFLINLINIKFKAIYQKLN